MQRFKIGELVSLLLAFDLNQEPRALALTHGAKRLWCMLRLKVTPKASALFSSPQTQVIAWAKAHQTAVASPEATVNVWGWTGDHRYPTHDKSLTKLITAASAPNTYFCLFIKVSRHTGSQIKTPITAWFAQRCFVPLKSHVQRKGEKEHGMTWVNLSKHPPLPNQKSCSVSSAYKKNHSGNTACKHRSGSWAVQVGPTGMGMNTGG